VDVAGHSNVPAGNTCWNCHEHVQKDSPKLAPLHRSMDTTFPGYDGKPIEWVRIHKAPDYVYFNHSAHVNRGISCQSCHGDVHKMEVVYQAEPLSMAWCLDCHRNPAPHLRPKDQVTHLGWKVEDLAVSNPDLYATIQQKNPGQPITQDLLGEFLKKEYVIRDTHYMTACSTCHR